ncbi:MAG: FkbM family methyltransferase [Sandaracinaceae bacterium]|nr:FkbM family methyltransferase [Sandaracinaceae bacterium]
MKNIKDLKQFVAQRINYNLTVSRGTRSVKIPVTAGIGRANLDAHEEHVGVVIERLYTPGRLLVDIGVNIGQTLIKFSLIAGNECRYIGFEPNIIAARYVENLIHCNQMTRATIVPVALGGDDRLTRLLVTSPGSADPGASINDNIRDDSFYGASRLVPVFRADVAFESLGITEMNFLAKIDVEGAELEVIRGMSNTLRTLRPFVIMEILPPSDFSDKVNIFRLHQAEEIKRTMRDFGYAIARIGRNGELDGGDPTHDYLFSPMDVS